MDSPIESLQRALSRLPGFGKRSAERASLALLRRQGDLLDPLVKALLAAKENVRICSLCGGFTVKGSDPCTMCTSPGRDKSVICVVEEPGDIMALERTGAYRGMYHALHGKASASRGTGPDDLRLAELALRLKDGTVGEVVIATGTDLDGDATANFLSSMVLAANGGIRITRLAFGLPVDSGIAYSDPVTLGRALQGRK